MTRVKKMLLSSACILTMYSAPLHASEISEQGAEHLKKTFQEMVDFQQSMASMQGSMIDFDGEIKVTPANGYYAVTFPNLSYTDFSGKTTKVGVIALNAIPGKKEGQWKVAVALPMPITYFDSDNTPIGQLNIGQQKMAGLWLEDLNNFVKLDASYDNITFKDLDAQIDLKIPHTEVKYDLEEDAKGYWSGPMQGFAENIQILNPVEKINITMGKVSMDMNMEGYDPRAVKSFRDKMGAVANASNGQQMSAQHAVGIYNMVTDYLGKSSDGFSAQISVENLNVDTPAKMGNPETNVRIGKIGYGFDMKGFRQNDVSMTLRISFNGLDITPLPADAQAAAGLIPSALNLDISVNNLPFKELVDLGSKTLSQTAKNPQMAQMGGMQALMTLPQLFSQAGTNITFTNNHLTAPDYKAKVDGKFTADMSATQGAVGEAKMTLTGLDKIITDLQKEAQNQANPMQAQSAQQTLQGLSMLKMFGQMDQSQADTRSYHFQMTKDGQMLMNGTDINAMMGGGGR